MCIVVGYPMRLHIEPYIKNPQHTQILQKVATANYCKLKRVDVAPMVLGVNYETHIVLTYKFNNSTRDISAIGVQLSELLANFVLCMRINFYSVFQKSNAKIKITITETNLIRIKYPLSSFTYHPSGANIANFNKIHCTVFEQQLFNKKLITR